MHSHIFSHTHVFVKSYNSVYRIWTERMENVDYNSFIAESKIKMQSLKNLYVCEPYEGHLQTQITILINNMIDTLCLSALLGTACVSQNHFPDITRLVIIKCKRRNLTDRIMKELFNSHICLIFQPLTLYFLKFMLDPRFP